MDAAELLGISGRQFRRLLKRFREKGAEGLISKRIGKPSNNQFAKDQKEKALELLKSTYRGFGPKLASEKLLEIHNIKVSKETVRQWMLEIGTWNRKKRPAPRIHQSRARRSAFGEMSQVDGSPHDWFEDRAPRCCLLGAIDDATSAIMNLKFVKSESTATYFEFLTDYLKAHGRPKAFYTDRLSVFRINRPESVCKNSGLTQV